MAAEIDAMNQAMETLKRKLAYFQQQEAITVDPDQKFALHEKIAETEKKIAELEREIDPHPRDPSPNRPIDISRILKYAPADLIGREDEIGILERAWNNTIIEATPRAHVLSFIALGGEGKTSLVAKWAVNLASRDWPGCDAVFAWSFYSQGTREQSTASADLFLSEALRFFGEAEFADSAESAHEKGRRLARRIAEKHALLILDGLEPLQYAVSSPLAGQFKDPGLAVLLKDLAAQNRGLAILTSRYAPLDLQAFKPESYHEIELSGLSSEAGMHLLRLLGVKGNPKEFEDLVEKVKGHALSLNLLGTWLRDAYAGDIRRSDLVKFEEADREEGHGHAFHVLGAYVHWLETEGESGQGALSLLSLMGLFDRPADRGCIEALFQKPAIPDLTEALIGLSEVQRNKLYGDLEKARLLSVNRDTAGGLISLDTHPLLREYFAVRLQNEKPGAFRSAHQRLYEHLCATTPNKDKPTLENLQPLYQAVAHGCAAEKHPEVLYRVYVERILRGTGPTGGYSMKNLGAFGADLGAVACFFDTCWNRVSDLLTESEQSWLLGVAALNLRGLGRLGEALEPMRSCLEMLVMQKVWDSAATTIESNLSELELTLGEIAQALVLAGESVCHADLSGDLAQRIVTRSTHAYALHQSGQVGGADSLFVEAEKLQAEYQPEYPLLYSQRGFRYCDLLLASAERAAWQVLLDVDLYERTPDCLESCREASEHGEKILQWDKPFGRLLDIGLHNLTLARSALFTAILEKSRPDSCAVHLEQTVQNLRRAGTQHHIPRGLLTRAWLRFLQSKATGPDSAQSDLDEAWEITSRGPMPLFEADILLTRARLFGLTEQGREQAYPWQSPAEDLKEARRLIEKHGYGRRIPELEDAEAALKRLGSD